MRILVTGGNGYVGRTVCRLLMADNDVHVIDNLRYGEVRFAESELERLDLVAADIRDMDAIAGLIRKVKPEVIIHLAAIHYIPECDADPVLALTTNVQGTLNIAAACPPDCRLVYASSGAVYGPLDEPHQEVRSPVRPTDIYGHTKLHGEDYIRHFATTNGFAAVIVRLFNVVGPGETNPHVLPEIVAQLKAGRSAVHLGNIAAKRDFVHVSDAAAGFAAVALHGKLERGSVETVNLGSSQTYSVEELIDMLAETRGAPIKIETDAARLRASDRPFMCADIERIGQHFGWKPEKSIKDAIDDMWREPELPRSLVDQYTPAAVG